MISDAQTVEIIEEWQEVPATQLIPRLTALGVIPGLATVEQGVRRCGKSSLLRAWIANQNLDKSEWVFLNFEDPRLADSLDHEFLSQVLRVSKTRNNGRLPIVCFDEIQEVKGRQNWVHSFLERSTSAKLTITGANASRLIRGACYKANLPVQEN